MITECETVSHMLLVVCCGFNMSVQLYDIYYTVFLYLYSDKFVSIMSA